MKLLNLFEYTNYPLHRIFWKVEDNCVSLLQMDDLEAESLSGCVKIKRKKERKKVTGVDTSLESKVGPSAVPLTTQLTATRNVKKLVTMPSTSSHLITWKQIGL